jgi:hypothetical protein
LLHEVERICNRIAIIDEGRGFNRHGAVSRGVRSSIQIRTDRTEQAFHFCLKAFAAGVQERQRSLYLKIAEDIAAVNHSLVSQGCL